MSLRLKIDESDRNGGRKKGRIELGEEEDDAEGRNRWDTGCDEHMVAITSGKVFIQNTTAIFVFLFVLLRKKIRKLK